MEVTCLGLPDGALHPDRELISLVESDLIARKCTTLITHSPHAANDHQDHLALGAATTNAAARVPTCHTVLYGESHAPYSGFSPTVLVDITDFLDDKIKALARQTSQLGRWYLREGYTRHRAADAAWRLIPPTPRRAPPSKPSRAPCSPCSRRPDRSRPSCRARPSSALHATSLDPPRQPGQRHG
ncbi:PIG-L deacetylase family protein [Streptomyces griseoruber]|uniref:PIG-L deacetylase family protein n=1 Tax=Streptomyces griseoruber TaxID=1943 RepID=UPI0037BAF8EB